MLTAALWHKCRLDLIVSCSTLQQAVCMTGTCVCTPANINLMARGGAACAGDDGGKGEAPVNLAGQVAAHAHELVPMLSRAVQHDHHLRIEGLQGGTRSFVASSSLTKARGDTSMPGTCLRGTPLPCHQALEVCSDSLARSARCHTLESGGLRLSMASSAVAGSSSSSSSKAVGLQMCACCALRAVLTRTRPGDAPSGTHECARTGGCARLWCAQQSRAAAAAGRRGR